MKYSVERYTKNQKQNWDNFVLNSRNSTFLFHRDFMDYHADRFEDHSVVIYDEKENLVACFPANEKEGVIYAHQGLTYGGLVQRPDDKLQVTLEIWQALLNYYNKLGFQELFYKHIPNFFNLPLIQDTEYAMFLLKAQLYRRDSAFVIDFKHKFKVSSNYKREAKKAQKQLYFNRFETDFSKFWNELLIPNLKARFGVQPVHSLEEIKSLKAHFSDKIKLFATYDSQEKMVAGTVLFDCGQVRHCQYIASSDTARKSGALNFMFLDLIKQSETDFSYFDFGIANEEDGKVLNKGLASWKQRMGGRTMIHDFYKINTQNSNLLTP